MENNFRLLFSLFTVILILMQFLLIIILHHSFVVICFSFIFCIQYFSIICYKNICNFFPFLAYTLVFSRVAGNIAFLAFFLSFSAAERRCIALLTLINEEYFYFFYTLVSVTAHYCV